MEAEGSICRRWDFLKCKRFVFAGVLLGRKDQRTVVSRCARKTVTLPGDTLGTGRARVTWCSPEIGQDGPSFVYEMEAYPSNYFACSWKTRKGCMCLDLLVSVLCVFVYVFMSVHCVCVCV